MISLRGPKLKILAAVLAVIALAAGIYLTFYRIRTCEENLDAVFVTAMAFARSRALNDEGGTFGKQLRVGFGKK